MSRAAIVAGALFVLAVAAMATAVLLPVAEPLSADLVLFPIAYPSFAAVGALIVGRRPTNRIGQLALLAGVGGSIVALADSWTRLGPPLPGQDGAAWLAAVGFPATLGPILFLVLLFPTGRLASQRWRPVAWIVAIGVAGVALGEAFSPEFAEYPARVNPFAIAALEGTPLDQGGLPWYFVLGGAVASGAGLVTRLRRAEGVERQQLKWIAFAGSLQALAWIIVAFDLPGVAGQLAQAFVFATLALIPAAAGIAILRYRLYDIDLVVRRTLVYGAVVAILGATYIALVLGLQATFSVATGGEMLPVAVSTLAIAALFSPVRARVRDAVDRRFYRSRYDAQRTVEAFAARLRDEVELEAVARSLTGTAGQVVRPASIGLWLRGRRRND